MADIFISYAREDQSVVDGIAQLIATNGLSVWWDRDIRGGDEFHATIENELNKAKKVVVVWSKASVGSMWVRDEAQIALQQRKIVPIVIDDCIVPLGFRSIHALRARDLALAGRDVLLSLGIPEDLHRGVPRPGEPQQLARGPVPRAAASQVEQSAVDRTRGADLRYNMEITLPEAFAGKTAQIRFPTSVTCEACTGTGAKSGTQSATCPTCEGSGRVTRERTLSVSIPAGVEDGTRMRLNGEGEAGMRSGPAGDLYIFLSIKPHEFFQRDGADIFCRVPVSMTTATLGGTVNIPTIDGGRTRVKVPEGTETGKQFRLRGKGMPIVRSKEMGDMYIQVEVETAKNLTSRQRELLESFERESHGETSPHSAGFFTRVKEFFEGKSAD
jgi:molecular chaperone DnaJ